MTILLSSFVFIFLSPKKKFIKNLLYQQLYAMGHCLFLLEHLFCLSHHKTCWTMSVDNVGLKICLLGISNSMVTLTYFALLYTEVVLGQIQQSITNFIEPWEDFIIHGVNNPLKYYILYDVQSIQSNVYNYSHITCSKITKRSIVYR